MCLSFCTSYLVINFIKSVILNMLKRSSSVAQICGGKAMPQRPSNPFKWRNYKKENVQFYMKCEMMHRG